MPVACSADGHPHDGALGGFLEPEFSLGQLLWQDVERHVEVVREPGRAQCPDADENADGSSASAAPPQVLLGLVELAADVPLGVPQAPQAHGR